MKQIVLAVIALVMGVAYLAWSSREAGPEPSNPATANGATEGEDAPLAAKSRESWPGQFDRPAPAQRAEPLPAAARPSTEPGSPERADEFARRKAALLAEANALIGQHRHADAARLLKPWLTEQDDDLFALWSEASNGSKRAERQSRIDQLQARVDALPANAHAQRSALYGQMAQLDPDSQFYRDEAFRYSLLANPDLARE